MSENKFPPVKGTTSGKQVKGTAYCRRSRIGGETIPFEFLGDNGGGNMLHFEATVKGQHLDLFIEAEEAVETLRLLEVIE